MMLDQSFSASCFRKIVDIENKKGNYLEGEFFHKVKNVDIEIKSLQNALRSLKKEKANLAEDEYEEKWMGISEDLATLKKGKESLLLEELEAVSKKINSSGLSFGIRKVDADKLKTIFIPEQSAPTFFTLKQIQFNIRSLYKIKQTN